MSKLYKTLCCNHEYIGINHSPVLETGYCLHCGYHPEIEKLKKVLEIAKEKLGFYADTHKNYTFLEIEKDSIDYHIKDRWMLDVDDDYEQMGDRVQWGVIIPKMFGGKRARQALKEIEEILGNKVRP